MQWWTTERGTLWAWEPSHGLPPAFQPGVEIEFEEIRLDGVEELAAAMGHHDIALPRSRLLEGRRCFVFRAGGQIATYGWVTQGPEEVGELERHFDLHPDEAYIWDCVTLPAWRGKGLYSALLSHLIFYLEREEVSRIWIGASRLNRPSVRGIANAGFTHVVDVTYYRFFFLTLMLLHNIPTDCLLVPLAYRLMLRPDERRIGPLAIGIRR